MKPIAIDLFAGAGFMGLGLAKQALTFEPP